MKRLLLDHCDADGNLDDDRVVAALLQYRNTPDPSTGISPASILFGRTLRDRIPIPPATSLFQNSKLAPVWRETWSAREEAMKTRFARQMESRAEHTRDLRPLMPRTRVHMQNLHGRSPIKATHKETEPPNEEPKEGRVLLDEFMKVQIM